MAFGAFDLGSNLGFPGPHVLEETVRQWEPDPKEFLFSAHLPLEEWPTETVEWDEEDPVTGMTHAHTLDSDPMLVSPRGRKSHQQPTQYYAESLRLRQSDFQRVRAMMAYNQLAGEELVMGLTRQGDLRLETRIEYNRAQALTGTFALSDNGVIRTVDYGVPAGNKPTAGTLWSNVAAATPAVNIMAWLQLFRGVGRGVTCYYNQITAQYLAQNEQLRDLFRQSSLAGELGPANVGKLLAALVGDGNPVEFKIDDAGYTSDAGTFTPFIANGKFLMLCNPPKGQKLGAFKTTPDVRNAGSASFTPRPGKFLVVDNKLASKNPYYEQTHGINGLVTIRFPKCIVYATVA